ncbi:MAG: HDIG domain-containing protein [Flavobacteriaceae bacterium]|nr:HDIG domain-containing protein [Flavobacteriaceae bacterium]MCI5088434.1 HDIG domain-containing protein [Flavobacteriaceae bacterium]
MAKGLHALYKNQSLIYKYLLYVLVVGLIVYLFPKGGQFKYEFQKGKPWQHETLYAPFDFSVKKTPEELKEEELLIRARQIPYFFKDSSVAQNQKELLSQKLSAYFQQQEVTDTIATRKWAQSFLDSVYQKGLLKKTLQLNVPDQIYLRYKREAILTEISEFLTISELPVFLDSLYASSLKTPLDGSLKDVVLSSLSPDVFYDKDLSEKATDAALSNISTTRGFIDKGKLIIAKGAVVAPDNYKVLSSLKGEYESDLWTDTNYYIVLLGYLLLVALVMLMLFLFLAKYRPLIYRDNTQLTFILANVLLMVLLTTLVIQYNNAYVFVVPLCILPLILKTFFDARLGLFVHVLTVLVLGFVVPNSFEFIFLQIMAGIVTILSVNELYKRANLFVSVGQITLVYIVGYFAFHVIQEGSVLNIQWLFFGLFALNGMITLFAQPLIYIYEKLFGLVSEVSLLELSDTNSKLLKELSNKAPGTFHHSLQVANLAEAAANEIGANAMLVRVGALYHDIGKMNHPTYFSENQISSVNPHHELDPIDSAKIILDHVKDGIEIAKKYNLPDRLIDFIRVHHGTTQVYYFYKKAQETDPEVSAELFTYPGPLPFSKETAILMMADAVEAASKSLKNPTYLEIDAFVEKIIDGQMKGSQYVNANITFKEIEQIKKVLKGKLTNIYHLRVAYPE